MFMRASARRGVSGLSSDDTEWSLWTVPLSGGEVSLVFEHPEINATRPAWCWTSGRIAFTGIRNGGAGLWLIEEDGTHLTHIPVGDPPSDRIYYPSWYPDGRSIAVTDYGKRQVLRVDVGSGAVEPLTDPNVVWAGMSSVSPGSRSGNPLAFAGQEPGGRYQSGENRIWIQRSGREPYELDGSQGRNPAWSPDGGHVAFASMRARPAPTFMMHERMLPAGVTSVFVERVRDPDEPPATAVGLSPFDHSAVQPKWSPDGRRLVCTAYAVDGNERGVAIIELARALD